MTLSLCVWKRPDIITHGSLGAWRMVWEWAVVLAGQVLARFQRGVCMSGEHAGTDGYSKFVRLRLLPLFLLERVSTLYRGLVMAMV